MDFQKRTDLSMCAFLGVSWCIIVVFVILPKAFLQNFFFKLWAKIYLANQFTGFFNFWFVENYLKTHVFLWLGVLNSSQCCFKIESAQLIFYANSLVALYMNKAVCFGLSWTFICLYPFFKPKNTFLQVPMRFLT